MNTDMRKCLIGLLIVLFSCEKPSEEVPVNVSFSLSGLQTKVTGVSYADESAVVRWTLFVFDMSGAWFRYGSSADAAPLVLRLQAGRPYRCLALVNCPLSGSGALNPATVSSAGELAGKVADLADNEPGRLLMFGEALLIPSAQTQSKTIYVKRLVSRVDVPGISIDFSSCPEWDGKSLMLRHIYVTNACKTTTYAEDNLSVPSALTAWYNPMGWHGYGGALAGADLLLGDRDINVEIDAAHPYSTPHSFYFYPNPTEEDSHRTDVWCPRRTRLVIEASVDGETYYYPIDIPLLTRNAVCSASNIVIHGPGWSHPEGGTITGSVLNLDWDAAAAVTLD